MTNKLFDIKEFDERRFQSRLVESSKYGEKLPIEFYKKVLSERLAHFLVDQPIFDICSSDIAGIPYIEHRVDVIVLPINELFHLMRRQFERGVHFGMNNIHASISRNEHGIQD